MQEQLRAVAQTHSEERAQVSSKVYAEGLVAGALGAATLAIWFLILDSLEGRPLYTPTLLGTALFRGTAAALDSPHTLPASFDMALVFTWVHALIFTLVGGAASRLLAIAERTPNLGFGILLFFVIFECGFVVGTTLFAEAVLHVLAWPAVLVGNVLAAGAMAAYLWRRHPNLRVEP
ncbi:MAG: hypothetical protein ACE5I7_00235 [Candidatus Binatia bacterium]